MIGKYLFSIRYLYLVAKFSDVFNNPHPLIPSGTVYFTFQKCQFLLFQGVWVIYSFLIILSRTGNCFCSMESVNPDHVPICQKWQRKCSYVLFLFPFNTLMLYHNTSDLVYTDQWDTSQLWIFWKQTCPYGLIDHNEFSHWCQKKNNN